MFKEAMQKLQAAAPDTRVDLFANFAAQIEKASKGGWKATRQNLAGGGAVFVGTLVENTLVIDKEGCVYRGNLIDKEQFPQFDKPNFKKLRKLF